MTTDLPLDANAAFHKALAAVCSADDESYEAFAVDIGMAVPQARILHHPGRTFAPAGAVARLVWHLAGDDQLLSIAPYNPHAARFSADGLVVPGSCYGRRLLRPRSGGDQLKGVIGRLRRDPAGRKAAMVIWEPEDATREPFDIPCAFGMFFVLRRDGLHTTTVMRSNKPFSVLPYNLFEFSMIGEVVAATLNVPYAAYRHWSNIMHAPDAERAPARQALQQRVGCSLVMPQMPHAPEPLEQIARLCAIEQGVRTAPSAQAAQELYDASAPGLHPYWRALAQILLEHRTGQAEAPVRATRWPYISPHHAESRRDDPS